jgi:hypothetical protein
MQLREPNFEPDFFVLLLPVESVVGIGSCGKSDAFIIHEVSEATTNSANVFFNINRAPEKILILYTDSYRDAAI